MNNRTQPAGLRLHRFREGKNTVVAAEIGLQTHRAGFAQGVNRRIMLAIADDHRLLLV